LPPGLLDRLLEAARGLLSVSPATPAQIANPRGPQPGFNPNLPAAGAAAGANMLGQFLPGALGEASRGAAKDAFANHPGAAAAGVLLSALPAMGNPAMLEAGGGAGMAAVEPAGNINASRLLLSTLGVGEPISGPGGAALNIAQSIAPELVREEATLLRHPESANDKKRVPLIHLLAK